MESVRVIKVFLASPMDLVEERETFRRVLERISERFGRRLGARFDVVCWERDVRPDCADDAQDVVNRQIPLDYDVFVALFGRRLGTPTHRAASGTVEEYERALVYRAARPDVPIMCYFLGTDETGELGELKARMASDGVLFHELPTADAFEETVFGHFTDLLLDRVRMRGGPSDLRPDRTDAARSVSVALLDEQGRVLILRRPHDAKVAPDLWQLPGGKMDADELPIETAVREIGEELGLHLDPDDLTYVRTFHSTTVGKGSPRPFDMHLYLCERRFPAGSEPTLSSESSDYRWLDLDDFYRFDGAFLGTNLSTLRVLWRELNVARVLSALLEHCERSCSLELPRSLPGISGERLSQTYAMLSLLGLVEAGHGARVAGKVALKVIAALCDLSRSDGALFENSHVDMVSRFGLGDTDCRLLRDHLERSLYSHESLLVALSCKTETRNSVRDVCDVLVFGRCDKRLYLLLRWDFHSSKYQMLASGTPRRDEATFQERVDCVVSRRLDSSVCRQLDHLLAKSFTTYHLSAGSVDDDPILRRYDIDVSAASVRPGREKDFLRAVRNVNEATKLALEFGWGFSPDELKELGYFTWCPLDELLCTPTTYRDRPVRGFAEIMQHLSVGEITRLASHAAPIDSACLDDDLDACVDLARAKRVPPGRGE